MKRTLQAKPDVCLLLEGTYPYVAGGVSTWVHQIISALPELQFSLFFIGSEKSANLKFKYTLPGNIISVDEVYLHESGHINPPASLQSRTACLDLIQLLRTFIFERPTESVAETTLLEKVCRSAMALGKKISFDTFWNDPGTWELVADAYEKFASGESFIDFFYAVRALIEPMWKLLMAVERIPPARMYHSLCTGYAGFAAGLASSGYESAYLLSEHGIYVRERVAELQKARWITDPPVLRPALYRQSATLRQLWIEFFRLLGRFAYQTANYITSLFENNARTQVEFGADPKRIEIIPNGIHMPEFYQLRGRARAKKQLDMRRMNVGFIGRVVQIKDVKTLLKSARLLVNRLPGARILIAGPLDEEPEYVEECRTLCEHLKLTKHVEFMGPQKIDELLPELDVMVLTSISEGLPFVILEAFAAGIPIVSTDVGACRELIEGRPDENPHHGPAGFIVPVGNSEMLADAMASILMDPRLGEAMGQAGRLRVEQHYSRQRVVNRYRQLYSFSPKDFAKTGLVSSAGAVKLQTSRTTLKA